MSWTSWFGSRNVIGPMSTPANAPSAAPIVQLSSATAWGEWPMLAAACSPSATAAVTRPNDVNRYAGPQRRPSVTAPMTKMSRRSMPNWAPKTSTERVGRIGVTCLRSWW